MIKKCASCKEEKELSYFHKNASQPDGFHHTCKLCRTHQSKEYARKNAHVLKEKNQKHYLENRDKRKQQAKDYYYDNKDKVLEAVHKYYYNNSEKIIEYKKEYRVINRDNIITYRKRNKQKAAAISAKRRSRKLQRTPKWMTREQFLEIESKYEEARSLTELTGILYHVDHIVPLKGDMVSGLHVPWNLQVIPASINLVKSNKLLESYL